MVRDFESTSYQYPSRLTGSIIFEKVKIRSSNLSPYDYYGSLPNYFRALLNINYDLLPVGTLITIAGVTHIQFVQTSNIIAIKYDVNSG